MISVPFEQPEPEKKKKKKDKKSNNHIAVTKRELSHS